MRKYLFLGALMLTAVVSYAAEADYWVAPMTEVHKKFTGEKGTVLLIGDSITEYKGFWTPVGGTVKECPKTIDLEKVKKYVKRECWDLKGEKNGNKKGWTVKQASNRGPIRRINPEVVILLLGANDARVGGPEKDKYEERMLKIIDACLEKGTIVIITTLSPFKEKQDEVAAYNKVVHKMAEARKLPVIEFYDEWMKLAGSKWQDLLDDDVHPTWSGTEDWSKDGLLNSGYSLRNYVTVAKYYEVMVKVLQKQ